MPKWNSGTDSSPIIHLPPDAASALIPATTALATLASDGRERGILAGANVVMPNLSPREERKKYELYNDKASLGAESAEGLIALQKQLNAIGYEINSSAFDESFWYIIYFLFFHFHHRLHGFSQIKNEPELGAESAEGLIALQKQLNAIG